MKPISTGSRARSIGTPSATITTRNCRAISTTRNTFQFRTRESSISASLWSWISLVSSYPTTYDEVRHIFSRRGAYRRYKDLLVRRGALDLWYDFSNKAEEAALREWC